MRRALPKPNCLSRRLRTFPGISQPLGSLVTPFACCLFSWLVQLEYVASWGWFSLVPLATPVKIMANLDCPMPLRSELSPRRGTPPRKKRSASWPMVRSSSGSSGVHMVPLLDVLDGHGRHPAVLDPYTQPVLPSPPKLRRLMKRHTIANPMLPERETECNSFWWQCTSCAFLATHPAGFIPQSCGSCGAGADYMMAWVW